MNTHSRPVLVLRGVVPAACCEVWRQAIDTTAAQLPAGHPDVQPTSGSLRLQALGEDLFAAMLAPLHQAAVDASLHQHLGEAALLLRSQAWARRQYPVALRPSGQHPHQWHQDGALGCSFGHQAAAPQPMLRPMLRPMLTVWLALADCGVDAPSLEWLELGQPAPLLWPQALADTPIAQRFGHTRRRQAVLAAGDALAFGGAVVHRTHVLPSMTRARTSIEARWVPATAAA